MARLAKEKTLPQDLHRATSLATLVSSGGMGMAQVGQKGSTRKLIGAAGVRREWIGRGCKIFAERGLGVRLASGRRCG